MSRIIVLLVLTIYATSLLTNLDSQYVPVSKRYPGLVIGSDNTPVTVQLVYDPTCGGTAEFDQIIRQVISNLGNNLSKVTFKYAINALPYHISSFKLAQAIKFVYDHNGSTLALATFRQFLDNIQKWDEKAILKISLNDHMNNIARKVAEITNISYDVIRPEIAHYSVTDNQTRKWTKYVMGSLRIPGTPFIFVNGARLDGGTSMTADQLTDFIVKLL